MITSEQLEELREMNDTWKEVAENLINELDFLRKEYSKVNNSLHGSETSVIPNAWEHIEDLKQSNGKYWREIQKLKEEARELKHELEFLQELENMGVDSWEGYEEAKERWLDERK